jgi:spore coat polysaccharide biosynthesis protein SpsF
MRTLAITQARYGSTRLPGKVLKEINGKTLLQLHLERVAQSRLIEKIVVATTFEKEADRFVPITSSLNVDLFQGSTLDVLDRFYQAAKQYMPAYVVRLTSDCPLLDSRLIDEVVAFAVDKELDYCSNTLQPTFPDGQDVEVLKFSALEKAWKEATSGSDREHVTPYIWRNSSFLGGSKFVSDCYTSPVSFSDVRLTVDQEEDFQVIKILIEQLGENASWKEYAKAYQHSPAISLLNHHITRNEGFLKSIKNDG